MSGLPAKTADNKSAPDITELAMKWVVAENDKTLVGMSSFYVTQLIFNQMVGRFGLSAADQAIEDARETYKLMTNL